MYRLKFFVLITIVMLGLTWISYEKLAKEYERLIITDLKIETSKLQQLFARTTQQISAEFLHKAREAAQNESLVNLLSKLQQESNKEGDAGESDKDDSSNIVSLKEDIYDRIFAEVAAINTWVKAEQFIVVDDNGSAVARNIDVHYRGVGAFRSYPLLKKGLNGETVEELVSFDQGLARHVVSPIKRGKQIVGALLLGYSVNDLMARNNASTLNSDFLYFVHERSIASTLPALIEQNFAELLKENADRTRMIINDRATTMPLEITLNNKRYIAVMAPLTTNSKKNLGGYAIITSLDNTIAPFKELKALVPITGVLAWAITIILSFFILRNVYKPIERMEHGISEVLNGKHDYEFKPYKPSLDGGLAERMNMMIAALLGKQMPSSKAREEESWTDPLFND